MNRILIVVGLLALGACSGKGPVKPNCDGTLRPINPPVVAERRS